MAYIALDNDSKILLFDFLEGKDFSSPIGELFLSFLELDLIEYNDLYHFIYSPTFNYYDFESLCRIYPNTYKELLKMHNNIISHNTLVKNRGGITMDLKGCILPEKDTEKKVIRDCAIPFLTENKDVFSNLYEHAFFSFNSIKKNAIFADSTDLRSNLDFYYFQKKFKNIVDFCFFNTDKRLSKLTKQELFFVFLAAETQSFETGLETYETILPLPLALYSNIKKTAFNHFGNDFSYNAFDILPLLDDSDINKIKENIRLVNVGLCHSIHDFLSFELKKIFSKDIDIKRCANCGKLFIPSGKYNTDCCDKIPEGQKYTCKKIMAQKRRKIKVDSDPIEKEYQKAYKRMYARVSSGVLKKSDFFKWAEEAKEKRNVVSQQYAQSNDSIIIAEFKKFLGNK